VRGAVAVPLPDGTDKTSRLLRREGMLEIRNLVKKLGPMVAVDDVSFSVPAGEVLGFLGPNGAGKSTTMKMITGFLAPTAGTAVICGHDIQTQPLAAKRQIGYLPEGAPAYPDMTAAEFLDFIAHIRGFHGAEARRRVADIAELIHIADVLHQPIETLSKGYRRRVGVAQALLHDPAVLVLDEPTDGLDPNQKYEMRGIIRRLSPGKAIIISTHLLEEVELGKHLFGRLLADVAGVENDQIGVFRGRRRGIAERRHQIGHARRIVDVHLATIGLDEEALGHRHCGATGIPVIREPARRRGQAGAPVRAGFPAAAGAGRSARRRGHRRRAPRNSAPASCASRRWRASSAGGIRRRPRSCRGRSPAKNAAPSPSPRTRRTSSVTAGS